jgi:hypothetical protein
MDAFIEMYIAKILILYIDIYKWSLKIF